MKGKTKIVTILDVFACLILTLAFTSSPYYLNAGDCQISLGYIMSAMVFFIVLLFIVYQIRKYLSSINWEHIEAKNGVPGYLEKIFSNKHSVLYIALVIMTAWIIPLIFLYPGTVINDTWGELQQFINFNGGNGGLSDHHPIFDTMVMGVLIVPLSKLTGEWHLFIFLYVLPQAFMTSLAFASTINYAYKKLQLGTFITAGLLFVYCLLPVFPTSVQTVSKDSLHSWGFVFYLLCFLEVIRTKGEVLKNKKFIIKMTLIVLFCCLTKKVGFYVELLSLLAVLIFQRNNRRYLLIPIVCSVLLMSLAMPMVRTVLEATPGGKQEMLSLPFQMTARYVKYHSDDITEVEYEVIDKVLTMETLAERYYPTAADSVKDYYQKGEDKDYVEYLKVWFKQGLRHPLTYMEATNSMLAGWFSWDEYAPVMNMDWRSQHNTEMIPEWVAIRGFSNVTANAYQEMYHNLYKIPILQIFLSYGFYASLLPAFAACTVLRRWKKCEVKYWLGIVPPVLALVLGCWLAPVSVHFEGRRYLYPIVYTLPLIIIWCLYVYKENREENADARLSATETSER